MNRLELQIPPLVLLLVFAAAMWALSAVMPGARFALPGAAWIAAGLGAGGAVIALLGVSMFRSAGTTVDPRTPHATKRMVRHGVYRLSRNPMYLGFALVLTGWALFLSHTAAVMLVPVFILYIDRFQIAPEEQFMIDRFGDEHRDYAAGVRRWI